MTELEKEWILPKDRCRDLWNFGKSKCVFFCCFVLFLQKAVMIVLFGN